MTDAEALHAWRLRWRVFGPLWIVFAAWPLLGLTAERFGHGRLFFWLVVPVFFVSFFVTVRRVYVHRVSNWQAILLATLVPFLIALVAGGLWHVVVYLLGVE